MAFITGITLVKNEKNMDRREYKNRRHKKTGWDKTEAERLWRGIKTARWPTRWSGFYKVLLCKPRFMHKTTDSNKAWAVRELWLITTGLIIAYSGNDRLKDTVRWSVWAHVCGLWAFAVLTLYSKDSQLYDASEDIDKLHTSVCVREAQSVINHPWYVDTSV